MLQKLAVSLIILVSGDASPRSRGDILDTKNEESGRSEKYLSECQGNMAVKDI
jgi:hypothetical protein